MARPTGNHRRHRTGCPVTRGHLARDAASSGHRGLRLVAPLVLVTLLTSCAERHPGIEVRVALQPTAQPDAAARVHLDVAKLHLTSVRGVPCGEALARALDALHPVSTAHAHGAQGGAGALKARVDVSLDLALPDPQPIATIRPAPGAWCGLEVEVGPDEATATSLLIDARRGDAARRYLSASTRRVRLERLQRSFDEPRPYELVLSLDAGPVLASLDPAANDARRELLDTLLASIRWNDP